MARLMILGAGDLGQRVCYDLAHTVASPHIQLVGRDSDRVIRAANLARFSSIQRGYDSDVTHAVTDLNDVDRTSQVVSDFEPDVVFLAVSLQSWWVISTLPKPSFERLYAANYGPWLPMHLVPVAKAMRAIRACSTTVIVVNAAYPDAVHPALRGSGLSPDLGIGNVANNVPAIRAAVADRLNSRVQDIEVRMVAHHYVSHRLSRHGDTGNASLLLEIRRCGTVVDMVALDDVLGQLPKAYRRTGGISGQAMTASSAVSVLSPLLDRTDALVHSPGPGGLIGGYPVRLSGGAYRIELPWGVSMAEADAVNRDGQRADGIQSIEDDGTVTFEPECMKILQHEFGYKCESLQWQTAEEFSDDLSGRFARYAKSAALL